MAAFFVKSHFRNHLNGWIRLLRAGLLLSFDSMVLLTGRKNSHRQEGAIFCLHGLGDLLLAGHAVNSLADQMREQGLRPVLFVHPSRVEFARLYFGTDRVEGIDRHAFSRRLGYRAAVLKAVAGRFAVAVQPTFNRMLRVEDCLIRATGARERIGSAGHALFISPQERFWGDLFYTKLVVPQPGPMHELERSAEFMAGMGVSVSTEPWRFKKLAGHDRPAGLPGAAYLVVSPDASDTRRSWPMEKFLNAARQVATRHQLAVVLVGDKKHPVSVRWSDGAAPVPELVDLRGQTLVEDLPVIIAGAELVVSNDSGVYHLAVSLDRPAVAVGGSGLPARYFPYPREADLATRVLYQPVPCAGCNWRCIYTASRAETAWCLQQISWEQLAEVAGEILRQRSKT